MDLQDMSLLDEIIKLEIPDCDSNDFVLEKDIMEELKTFQSSLKEEDDLYSLEEKVKKNVDKIS